MDAATASHLAVEAEHLGYTHVWIGDSQLLWREMAVIASFCASRTNSVIIGSGVANLVTRDPSVLAGIWGTLSEASEGRVAIGLGTGDSAVRLIGRRPTRVHELEDGIARLRALLTASGNPRSVPAEATLRYRDRVPRIPIYVGASGSRMLEMAGRTADGVLLMVGRAPGLIRNALASVQRGAHTAGRRLEDLDVVVEVPACITTHRSDAYDAVRPHVARDALRPIPVTLTESGMHAAALVKTSYDYYRHMSGTAQHIKLVTDELVEWFALAGDEQQCRAQLSELATLPIAEVAIIPFPATGESELTVLERFASLAATVS